MKKILFFNSNLAWGGGEKWHLNMALALSQKDFDVSIVCLKDSELKKQAELNQIKTIEIKLSNTSFLNPIKRFQIKSIIKKVNPHTIILNLPRDVKICAQMAKKVGVTKVIYRRGMPHPLKRNFFNKSAFQAVDIFIANSNEIKRSIVKNFPELNSKVHIVYNGVEPLDNINLRGMNTPLKMGNIGRLVPQKGQKHLIKLAKILKEKEFSFHLAIVGEGPEADALTELIQSYQLEDCVTLQGHRPASEVFPEIDLFVFSSHFEGSANALIEALQYQVPTIAFDISSNPEVIEHNKEGLLVPPFEIAEMAKEIISLSKNPILYKNFQKNAKIKILERFNYQDKVNQIIELIN